MTAWFKWCLAISKNLFYFCQKKLTWFWNCCFVNPTVNFKAYHYAFCIISIPWWLQKCYTQAWSLIINVEINKLDLLARNIFTWYESIWEMLNLATMNKRWMEICNLYNFWLMKFLYIQFSLQKIECWRQTRSRRSNRESKIIDFVSFPESKR